MLEASNVISHCVLGESPRGLPTGEKMNAEVIQNYLLNAIIVLALLLRIFLPTSHLICEYLTVPAVRLGSGWG